MKESTNSVETVHCYTLRVHCKSLWERIKLNFIIPLKRCVTFPVRMTIHNGTLETFFLSTIWNTQFNMEYKGLKGFDSKSLNLFSCSRKTTIGNNQFLKLLTMIKLFIKHYTIIIILAFVRNFIMSQFVKF